MTETKRTCYRDRDNGVYFRSARDLWTTHTSGRTISSMASALTPTGSTRAWRRIRQPWTNHLQHVGPLPCRRCGQLIYAGDQWHLGHPDHAPRALGGDDTDLWPEHQHCSTQAGATLGRRTQKLRALTRRIQPVPTRDW